jgi:hypothetical protein
MHNIVPLMRAIAPVTCHLGITAHNRHVPRWADFARRAGYLGLERATVGKGISS